jgi:hypothetical protein
MLFSITGVDPRTVYSVDQLKSTFLFFGLDRIKKCSNGQRIEISNKFQNDPKKRIGQQNLLHETSHFYAPHYLSQNHNQ